MSNQSKIIKGTQSYPTKPAFYAFLSADENNVTGNGALYTLGTNVAFTTRFDRASNLSSLNPVTVTINQNGIYFIGVVCSYRGVTIATANKYDLIINAPSVQPQYTMSYAPSQTFFGLPLSARLSLATNDTVTFQTRISGQAANDADIDGSAASDFTYVYGFLIA